MSSFGPEQSSAVAALDHLQARTSTVLRDIFHYLGGGVVAAGLSIPLVYGWLGTHPNVEAVVVKTLESDQFAFRVGLTVFGFVFLYGIGTLLHGLGMFVYLRQKKWWPGEVGRLERQLVELAVGPSRKLQPTRLLLCTLPPHLVPEMILLREAPELQVKFAERYNSLAHMRLTLAMAFFASGVAYVGHGLYAGAAGCLAAALVLYLQQGRMQCGFLHRVLAGYVIARQPQLAGESEFCFAYGSNMDAQQMRSRCPSAVALGSAALAGARLTFPRRSKRWQGGVAGYEPCARDCLSGVLYLVEKADLQNLDTIEGVPERYERVVETVDWNGHAIRAAVYRAKPEQPARPSAEYLAAMLRGAKEHRLPKKHRAAIQEIAAALPAGGGERESGA